MDVSAEKICRLYSLHPLAQCRASGVPARRIFVQFRRVRWTMRHHIERFVLFKFAKRPRDLAFRVFSWCIERRDVAVAESSPVSRPAWRIKRPHLPVKIYKAVSGAQCAHIVMALVISRQHPKPFAEWLEYVAALLQALLKAHQVAGIDIQIGLPGHNTFKRPAAVVNVAENQNLQGFWPFARKFLSETRTGSIRRNNIPSAFNPSSITRPYQSNTTRYVKG